MRKPRISIITPTFNRADFLRIAIDSVLAQSFGDFEHIIVDDGSTDQTPQFVEHYLTDPRIRYFRQENQGPSVARNVGIERSRGEFICFLDSDNFWAPLKLDQQLRLFTAYPDSGVIYGDVVTVDASGGELHRRNMMRHSGAITRMLLVDNFISMNTTMARASLIREAGGFRQSDGLAEDYGLWLRMALLAKFRYASEFWAYYRIMPGRLSDRSLERVRDNERLIRDFLQRRPSTFVVHKETTDALNAFYCRKARIEALHAETVAAWRSLGKAFSIAPLSSRVYRTGLRVLLDEFKRRAK